MSVLSEAAAARAQERLTAMVGPVVLRLPKENEEAAALAQVLAQGQPLLETEQGEEPVWSLWDGWGRPTGIQFDGLPVGQELDVLVDDIIAVSRGSTPVTPLGRTQARELPEGTELWIFSTPSCPRCAQASRLAHAMALESKGALTATMVDVSERPELITQYGATTVPFFVVNQRQAFPGPLPELILLQRLANQDAAEDL